VKIFDQVGFIVGNPKSAENAPAGFAIFSTANVLIKVVIKFSYAAVV